MLFAAALLAGCYVSEFPLDPAPRVRTDEALFGTWRCLPLDDDADQEPATVSVTRGPEHVYAIVWREGDSAPQRYEAYASSSFGTTLLNVQVLEDSGKRGDWVFVRYALLRPNVLHLQVVAKEALEGVAKTRSAVREAIERLRDRPTLYVDFCVCARAKQDE